MFEVNHYFDKKVSSLAFDNSQGSFTTGVMADGEYEFGTGKAEIMTVVSGRLKVLLPEQSNWQVYAKGESFNVPADSSFKVVAEGNTAYLCQYID